jgi:hypothetical protein
MEPFITKDGRYLIFNNRNDPPEHTDLFYAERVDDLTFAFKGEITGANSPALDAVASLDAAGMLYFVTTRRYERDLSTIYRASFQDGAGAGAVPVPGIAPVTPGIVTFDAEVSGDGATLYLVDGDFRGAGPKPKATHMVVAHRAGEGFVRSPDSDRLLARINDRGLNYAAAISATGLELFFTHVDAMTADATPQIFRATRAAADKPFGEPQHVSSAVGFVEAPSLSADGRRLYFHRRVGERFIVFEAER